MNPYLGFEVARFHQGEIRGPAAPVGLAREGLDPQQVPAPDLRHDHRARPAAGVSCRGGFLCR